MRIQIDLRTRDPDKTMNDFNPNSIDATLARIEAKLDASILQQTVDRADIEDLKKWRWFSAGIGAAIGFIADKLLGK